MRQFSVKWECLQLRSNAVCVYSCCSCLRVWGEGLRMLHVQQHTSSVFYPLVYQTYKAANCGWGEWAADLLQKTKLFRTQLCTKPCYVRAMEICSTFSCCKHCKLVAWGGIEPPTQGFSVLQNYYLAALNHVVEYIHINSLYTNNWMGEQFPC